MRNERTAKVSEYCAALGMWASTITDKSIKGAAGTIRMALMKSCLAKRLVYLGEALRSRKCPIHDGEWSGCYFERCPAGGDTCGCCCGWIPETADVLEGLGWTFWLTAAIDPSVPLPGSARLWAMRGENALARE